MTRLGKHLSLSVFNNRRESIILALQKPLPYRVAKRTFDVAFSVCVVSFGMVPGVLLSVFVAKDTGAFPIYTQIRVGKQGRPFRILKFRTMTANADDLLEMLSAEDLEELRREHKISNDPRITKLGAFLRSTSIDELPQFVNVLLGQIPWVILGPSVPTGHFKTNRNNSLGVHMNNYCDTLSHLKAVA